MSLKNRDFRTVLKIPRKKGFEERPQIPFDYIFKIPPTVLLTAYFDFSLLIICGCGGPQIMSKEKSKYAVNKTVGGILKI